MKHASNKPAPSDPADLSIVAGERADLIRAAFDGAVGCTVRCVPRRRTLMVQSGGDTIYAKLHRRRRAAAAAEWRWLHVLPLLGISAARPVAWVARGATSMVVTEAVAGRSLDAWGCDAAREGWVDEWLRFVTTRVAELVRRLHAQRLMHRDLNFAHVFCGDPRDGGGELTLIDVERMFEARWRRRRWIVKDLAALLASSPVEISDRVALRFLRNYLRGRRPFLWRSWARAIRRKADRIGGRTPRFG